MNYIEFVRSSRWCMNLNDHTETHDLDIVMTGYLFLESYYIQEFYDSECNKRYLVPMGNDDRTFKYLSDAAKYLWEDFVKDNIDHDEYKKEIK